MKHYRKLLSFMLVLAMLIGLTACGGGNAPAENPPTEEGTAEGEAQPAEEAQYHIGIVTGTVAQGEDELRGAEAAIAKYGDAANGGMIVHDTYPDNFMQEQETTISKIVAMADDPLMKAIIVNQSVPGTSAAFDQIRAKNPDILLIALTPQEDTIMVEEAADLAVDADNVSRGYRIIAAAKEMGATKFVHVSFPRHMSIELLALRRAIMEEACKDLGLEFITETAPDPMSDVGIPGAQQFIAENIPNWIEKYGKDTAFFCTNDAHTEPLLRGIAAGGAFFVEQDLPSPIMGYPGAFSIDLKDVAGDWPAINAKVEEAVVAAGGKERMGTWAYSLGYSTTLGAVDLAMGAIEGTKDLTSIDDLKASIETYTQGANWMGTYYVDRASGEEKKNHILVAQDTYVYGKGYLGIDKVEVPEKYMNLNVDLEALKE
ncbi:MAG: DUF3798 domain-containing protein [Filifactor alocis]|nr:DUF3798 domain-containing protein [Filifactor alocis]